MAQKRDSATVVHSAEPGSLEPAEDGWFYATCTCGWSFGAPLPDHEVVCDALMGHAWEVHP